MLPSQHICSSLAGCRCDQFSSPTQCEWKPGRRGEEGLWSRVAQQKAARGVPCYLFPCSTGVFSVAARVNLNFDAIVHWDAIYFKDSINPQLPLISQVCYIKRAYVLLSQEQVCSFLAWISTDWPVVDLKISQGPQKPGCTCPSEPSKCPALPHCCWECSPCVQTHHHTVIVTHPWAGWRGRSDMQQALGLFDFFFTLRKSAMLGMKGREEANSSLLLPQLSCQNEDWT